MRHFFKAAMQLIFLLSSGRTKSQEFGETLGGALHQNFLVFLGRCKYREVGIRSFVALRQARILPGCVGDLTESLVLAPHWFRL